MKLTTYPNASGVFLELLAIRIMGYIQIPQFLMSFSLDSSYFLKKAQNAARCATVRHTTAMYMYKSDNNIFSYFR